MYLIKTPFWIPFLYPSLTWHKSRKEKIIYLTFDDGPIPEVTPFVLDTLRFFNIQGSFFCVGENIEKHPSIYQQIKNDGHSMGNHTYNHLNGYNTSTKTYLNNIKKCQKLTSSNLFRPPYGKIKKAQIKALKSMYPQMKIIMWDVLSADFDPKADFKKCLKNVIKNTTNGSIIVFHDSIKTLECLQYALPRSIESLLKKGFSFQKLV